ncbi:MAG: FAD:protein FMN transferase [bacterium]
MDMRLKKQFMQIVALAAIVTAGSFAHAAGTDALKSARDTRQMMGTFVEITVYDADEGKAKAALEAGFAEIARVESVMSRFDPKSELSRLNRSGEKIFKCSDELFMLLEESRRYSELSGGAFDVTVGPLMKVWRDAGKEKKKPAPSAVEEARSRVGYKKIRLDPAAKTARFMVPGMEADLGAIAKGYGADRAAAAIRAAGAKSALVNSGGDIRAVGKKMNSKPWTIALQNPRDKKQYLLKLAISDIGVTTSGDYEQYFVTGGRRYSHIINPKTGTSETGCMSATVIAPTAMQADALSTTICSMEPGAGLRLIGKLGGVEAAIVGMDRRIRRSHGFSKYETE